MVLIQSLFNQVGHIDIKNLFTKRALAMASALKEKHYLLLSHLAGWV